MQTIVMGESETQLQELISTLTDENLRMGLEVNVVQTKTMVFDRNPRTACKHRNQQRHPPECSQLHTSG